MVGHVSLCQLNYLDVSVTGELKRRKTLRDKAIESNKSKKMKAALLVMLTLILLSLGFPRLYDIDKFRAIVFKSSVHILNEP